MNVDCLRGVLTYACREYNLLDKSEENTELLYELFEFISVQDEWVISLEVCFIVCGQNLRRLVKDKNFDLYCAWYTEEYAITREMLETSGLLKDLEVRKLFEKNCEKCMNVEDVLEDEADDEIEVVSKSFVRVDELLSEVHVPAVEQMNIDNSHIEIEEARQIDEVRQHGYKRVAYSQPQNEEIKCKRRQKEKFCDVNDEKSGTLAVSVAGGATDYDGKKVFTASAKRRRLIATLDKEGRISAFGWIKMLRYSLRHFDFYIDRDVKSLRNVYVKLQELKTLEQKCYSQSEFCLIGPLSFHVQVKRIYDNVKYYDVGPYVAIFKNIGIPEKMMKYLVNKYLFKDK